MKQEIQDQVKADEPSQPNRRSGARGRGVVGASDRGGVMLVGSGVLSLSHKISRGLRTPARKPCWMMPKNRESRV